MWQANLNTRQAKPSHPQLFGNTLKHEREIRLTVNQQEIYSTISQRNVSTSITMS